MFPRQLQHQPPQQQQTLLPLLLLLMLQLQLELPENSNLLHPLLHRCQERCCWWLNLQMALWQPPLLQWQQQRERQQHLAQQTVMQRQQQHRQPQPTLQLRLAGCWRRPWLSRQHQASPPPPLSFLVLLWYARVCFGCRAAIVMQLQMYDRSFVVCLVDCMSRRGTCQPATSK